MLSSFLFAGLLPLVAAEACSSVIAKTHIVTSVVTTVEYSTIPSDPSCTISHALPSEPPSSDVPATSSEPTFEWTAPAPPTGTDFEWLPTLEPTPPGPDASASTDVVEPSSSTCTTDEEKPVTTSSPPASETSPAEQSTTCTTDEEKPVTTSSPPASETSPEEQSTTCTSDISESTEVSSVPHTSAASDSSASTTAPGKTSATASEEEPCTTSTSDGAHTSAGESASATSGKDESEVTSTASEDGSEPTTTSAEESPATTTSAEEDSEATTSAEETSEATTTSAEESSEATTSHAEETPEAATTTSAEESSEATTTSAEETSEATTSAEETSEATTTSAEESAKPTTSAEESSVTSTSGTSEEAKTTEAPSTFSSVVITTSAASSEASTSSEVSTSTSSEAPKETKLPRNYPADIVDDLQDESMEKLKKWLSENNSNGCTLEKASIRREWGDLTLEQREDYIGAVLCLQSEPSRYAGEIPGARSRFDDFVVTHQAQTNFIHGTANFLTWHRYFLHEFEKALKNECGYKGVMPYWNWDRYANDPENSPLFNGDAGSLGGNAGRSGCVETGPFKDYKVSLGPGPSTRYNPRCLQREMSVVAARYTKVDVSYPLITQSNDVGLFQDRIQSGNNVHAAGHHTVGGNPGADIYTSPGDPYFHLHHAGVDRIFWIWQLQDLNSRLSQVAGQNTQTRRPGSLTETMNLGRNAGDVELGSLLNTMGGLDGGLCYIYY